MTRPRPRHTQLLLGLFLALPMALSAQQYRSEVRVLDEVPEDKPRADPEKLLEQAGSSYERAMLLRELAGRAARQERYAQAADFLGRAIKEGALSGQAQQQMERQLSELLVASGDPDAIIRGLEDKVRGNPDAAAAQQAALGSAYAARKRYREALPLLERAITRSREPQEGWLRALLATQIGLERTNDARRTVDRLLVLNPREPQYWRQAVALHRKAGDDKQAQAALEVAARLGFVSNAEQRRQLAGLTARIGAPYYAATQLEEWMESGAVPRNRETLRERAAYWLASREDGAAVEAVRDFLATGGDVEMRRQLGQLHMDREEYAQAIDAFQRVLAAVPGDADTRMSLAVARYQTADIEGALAAFKKAAQSDKHAALATDWIDYLESGRAREQAMTAARERAASRGDTETELARAVLGEPISLEGNGAGGGRSRGGLTPVGANAGPSADGVIPPWNGGITRERWPESYAEGDRLVDPYASDEPVATVTAQNMDEHAQYLSEGHKALLRSREGFRMPVYPTRRSVAYPDRIYEATRANADRARLIGSDSLEGARLGFPFRKPKNGVEAMWNHRVRYRGDSVMARTEQAVVAPSGDIERHLYQTERVYFRYANLEDPVDIDRQNVLLYYLSWFSRDPGGVDFLALVHEVADAADRGRAVWVLPPGSSRLFRVPPVGYDQPFPGSGGLYFVDMLDMYNGAFDRYDWKLIGKKQLYIPYNGFKWADGSYKVDELLRGGQPNPEAMRFERHRVWVIEATERAGKSHAFGKRVFYIDEDSWNVALVENYDEDGNLWRFQEGHILPLYNVQASNASPVVTYDLKDGRYFINRIAAETDPPQYDVPGIRASDYLPSMVQSRYAR
jgi:tetratricopeptide (TPR) repeat protein